MKRYWDTSALLESVESVEVRALTLEPNQFTRSHSLVEMFSTLTKSRKMGTRFSPEDAALVIRDVCQKMQFVELKPEEVLKALDKSHEKGVIGGIVHDWMHVVAAEKSGAEVIFTLNLSDFQHLKPSLAVKSPLEQLPGNASA